MQKLVIAGCLLLAATALRAQGQAVKGIVKDAVTGRPLAGATVTAVFQKTTTQSNTAGAFGLAVAAGDTLVISHVNYSTVKMSLGNTAVPLLINLVQVQVQLDEVTINTGYQKLKPNEVNGSYSVIGNEKLNEQKGMNVLDRLNGVTPGLLFKSGKKSSSPVTPSVISIRGESTINGPLDPLIILDNFPYDGDINNINPNDVETITVLKDAAATSIYGAKGGNGVIVITTKKGKFNSKTSIDAGSNIIFTSRPDLYKYQQLSPADFIDVEQFLFSKGYYNFRINSPFKQSISPAVEVFFKRKQGAISVADSAVMIDYLKTGDSREAYNGLYNGKTVLTQHTISVRGGSDNIAWMLGGNYDQSANYDRSVNRRINFRSANSYKMGSHLTLDAGINYTMTINTAGNPGYGSIRYGTIVLPYLRFTDASGNPVIVAKDYKRDYIDTAGNGRLLNWYYYPATDNKYIKDKTRQEDLIASIGLNIKIIKGLNAYINYQYEKQNNSQQKEYTQESYYARDLINRFTQLGATPQTDTFHIPRGGILLANDGRITSHNGRAQLGYDRNWKGAISSLSALAGMEIRSVVNDGNSYSIYGYKEDPAASVPVNYNRPIRNFATGVPFPVPNPPKINPVITNRYVSEYGNIAIGFYNRFSVNSSLRRDAANIFGLKTNDKWNPFWSSGVGWEISRENFFNRRVVNFMKLRATLGTSGIVNPNKTADAVIAFSDDGITGFSRGQVFSLNNPQLKWEKSRQLNIGLDFALAKNSVTGTVEYYNKKGTNLYGSAPFNYTAWGGAETIELNVANMEGNGMDVQLSFIVVNKPIRYNTSIIFNYNQSKTTRYFGPDADKLATLLNDGNTIMPIVGKPLYAIAAYKWGGLDAKGDPQGYLKGQLSTDYLAISQEANVKGINGNIVYIGPANPVIYGAWNHFFKWKGFELSCNLLYKLGYYFRKASLSYSNLYNTGGGNAEYAVRWRKPGDELHTNVPAQVYTSYPQFTYRSSFYEASEIQVLRGDHVRLQYINLSYTKTFERGPLKRATVNFNAANLGVVWRLNKYGIDPDYNYTSVIPPRPQYAVGLQAAL